MRYGLLPTIHVLEVGFFCNSLNYRDVICIYSVYDLVFAQTDGISII